MINNTLVTSDNYYYTPTHTVYLESIRQPTDKLLLIHSAEPPYITSQRLYHHPTAVTPTNTLPYTEAVYVTGDLWEQMLVKEKEKVKALEERYAERLRAEKVI